jgi:cytoskeleton protein RodZ
MALRQPRERRDDPPLTQRGLHLRAVDNEVYGGIGAELRRVRERTGGDLGDIAGRLRIRVELLEAIEDGRVDDLPDAVYALGFLRTYANYLGLDGEAAVTIFKDETQRYAGRSKLVFPLPGPGGRLPGGWLIATSVVLAALAYGGWYYVSEQDRIAVEMIPDPNGSRNSRATRRPGDRRERRRQF